MKNLALARFHTAPIPLGWQRPSRKSEQSGRGRARNARPYGVAVIPLHAALASGWQPFCGTPPLRAKRVLKGNGVIRKRGETAGVSPLVRSAAAQAAFPPAMRGQFGCALQGEYERARARFFAPLRSAQNDKENVRMTERKIPPALSRRIPLHRAVFSKQKTKSQTNVWDFIFNYCG